MSDLTVKDVQRITEEIQRFERVVRVWRECWEDTSPARCTHAVAALEAARRFLPIVQELAGAAPAVAPGAEAGVAETCPDCGHLDHAGRRCLAGCSIWHCSAGWRTVAPGAEDAGEGERCY